MKQYITIATGDKIPLGVYVQGVKLAITNPEAEFTHGLTTWWPTSGKDIRQQFLESIHDRINIKGRQGK